MTPEEMKVAIAGKYGWKVRERKTQNNTLQIEWSKCSDEHQKLNGWERSDKPCETRYLPNYPFDLNAMHEVEKIMTDGEHNMYAEVLSRVACDGRKKNGAVRYKHLATAAQRAEAFCRVFWPEKFKQ